MALKIYDPVVLEQLIGKYVRWPNRLKCKVLGPASEPGFIRVQRPERLPLCECEAKLTNPWSVHGNHLEQWQVITEEEANTTDKIDPNDKKTWTTHEWWEYCERESEKKGDKWCDDLVSNNLDTAAEDIARHISSGLSRTKFTVSMVVASDIGDRILKQMQPGDEIRFVCSPPLFWTLLMGSSAYNLVRNGKIIVRYVDMVN